MDRTAFTVVAGFEAAARHEAALATAAAAPSFDLPRWQERSDPTVAAEIVVTIYGYGLRYASGLQNFAIIASAQYLGTLEKALAYAQRWAAQNPDTNFVFIRNTSLAQAGAIAAKVAEREAGIARAAAAQREAQERLYGKAKS